MTLDRDVTLEVTVANQNLQQEIQAEHSGEARAGEAGLGEERGCRRQTLQQQIHQDIEVKVTPKGEAGASK